MLPNELRVGNWIMDQEPYDLVFEAGWNHIARIAYKEREYRGVILTEEWLIKFSFEKRKDKINIWDFDRLTVWLENGCLCYLREEDNQFSHYIPNGGIKYVHQLMNLVYALTGKELVVKNA